MTKSITVKIVNGFVSGGAGGNPAGVVLNAEPFDGRGNAKNCGSGQPVGNRLCLGVRDRGVQIGFLYPQQPHRPLRPRHRRHVFVFGVAWPGG